MGRNAGFVLGVVGLILPEFLFYGPTMHGGLYVNRIAQGLFYSLVYQRTLAGSDLELRWVNREWFTPFHWWGHMVFTLYLVSFGLGVLGLLIIRRRTREGAFLLLVAGLAAVGWMLTMYPHVWILFKISKTYSFSPIPVGALVLLGAGLVGLKD